MQLFVGKFSALMNPITYVIVNAATAALIWYGAIRVDNGYITQGAVVALVNYMAQILVELVKMANLIVTITKAVACANRIEGVFAIEPSIKEAQEAGKEIEYPSEQTSEPDNIIEFQNVSLTYADAGAEALTDINFAVRRGETIGVIGGTGSGKTSLVNLIPRFYDVTKGAILVDGMDVREYPLVQLRNKIGVVPQKAVLFHGTVRDNMKWGKKDASDEEIWQALETAQAKEFVEQKEGKLDFVVAQNGKNFSGGQRQRMTIARALVRNPAILILDDSASALDYLTDANLRQAISRIQGIGAVFIVSQRTSSISNADRIIVLDDGSVVGIGTHEQLLENCEVYQEIYESQYQGVKKA
jgi:ABC-type multidrug transport system fused ATPase/permease subunit